MHGALIMMYFISRDSFVHNILLSNIYLNCSRCCGCRKARHIVARWKSKEDFSSIQVSTSMLLDHGPSRTVNFIEHFFEQADLEIPAMDTIDDPEPRPRMSTV